MRVAIVSTFFPNASDPYRAVFVRNLALAMARHTRIDVVSPVPYAPPWPRRPDWQALRSIPASDEQSGLQVLHPRFVVIPKLTRANGMTYAAGITSTLRTLAQAGDKLFVHAHCAYPDGVGVARAASRLGLPFAITAHGSDINVYSRQPAIRSQLRWAMQRARFVIAVSKALRQKILEIVPEQPDRVVHVPCAGFNPSVFFPGDRLAERQRLGLSAGARVALFVGQLVPIKAIDNLLVAWQAALAQGTLTATDRLLLIGEGPLRQRLQALADSPESKGTVQLIGARPQPEIASYLKASDLLCLPSHNEGMPNVIIEAFASGVPVLATAVGGVPELVQPGVNGLLVPPANPAALASALGEVFDQKWDTAQIAAGASGYTWQALAETNIQLAAGAVS